MPYTVKDALSNPLLKNSTLLSAHQAVAAKTIESVSVIEMPVDEFVRKNDFVLTTAFGCRDNSALFQSFVNDVYQSGASALAIATGRYVDGIPDEVIRFADELHFPIIELPWEILFSDITKTIFEEIHQRHQNSLLALWLQKEQTMVTEEMKKIEEYIQILIKKEWVSKESVIEKGRKLGLPIESSYVCIVGFPENTREFQLKKGGSLSNHFWNMLLSTKLKETAEAAATKLKKQLFCSYQHDQFIIFLESHYDHALQNAQVFLDLLDQSIKNEEIPLFSWGIGENHTGIMTFHQSYMTACTALEMGRSHRGPGQRNTYYNTGIYRMLTTLLSDRFAIEQMNSTIGAIASYDKEKGLGLLHTLSTYIFYQGNVSQTSRALSLHRQSLMYRLRKIESLTNRSLSEPDDLFLLQICLKLWNVRFKSRVLENSIELHE